MTAKKYNLSVFLFVITLISHCQHITGFNLNAGNSEKKSYVHHIGNRLARSNSIASMSMNKVPGSFFNPVPEESDEDKMKESEVKEVENIGDEFDKSISELMKKRTEKPRAAAPSTIDGKPVAKGFGNSSPKSTSTKSKPTGKYVGIGPPDTVPRKPLNDVNNPEYDDQGYTLYADEKTGEKSRVFEALVNYPCKFKIKIVGANEGTFVSEMVALVAESCNVEADDVDFSEKRNGKWISVTVAAPVESAAMLYALYENIDRDPRVKFKF